MPQLKLYLTQVEYKVNLNFRQHEDHETDPVTPGGGDDGAFVVDEEAGSENNSSVVVTRSSSAREVVRQNFTCIASPIC